MRTLSIAALQTAPVAGDPAATLDAFADQATGVRHAVEHAQMLVLPELHLSAPPGLLADAGGHADRVAVELPGPLTERLEAVASKTGLWLIAGSVYEHGPGEIIHNTALAISPERGLVARYRKLFPWQPSETSAPGDAFCVFDLGDLGRVGLAICYDGFFPEVFRQLAWLGAEVVIQPTLTTTSDRAAELVAARANAIVNQMFVVSLNAAAPAAVGRSLIVDPEGRVRAETGSAEELMTDVIDLDQVRAVREHGTGGVSRMWRQIDDGAASGVDLPMYAGGRIRPRQLSSSGD